MLLTILLNYTLVQCFLYEQDIFQNNLYLLYIIYLYIKKMFLELF